MKFIKKFDFINIYLYTTTGSGKVKREFLYLSMKNATAADPRIGWKWHGRTVCP